MASNESIIKEAKNNLENAQKELLKEINTQKNPLQRLFSNAQSAALKSAQSFLAKALNQLNNLNAGTNQNAAKLQANLSQKDADIKALEDKLKSSEDKVYKLEGNVTFFENQIKDLETKLAQKTEEANKTPETLVESQTAPIADNKLEEKVEKLNQENKDLVEKFKQSESELKEAQNIAAEVNTRLKKLKSEVLSS